MNIFNKVALKSMEKSRTRTIVTVMGVVLSAAMITAVATFAVSLQSYMINGAAAKYGDWHIEIPDADSSWVLEQAEDSRVKNAVALQNIGYATLEGGQNPDKPYLFIAEWNEEALNALPIKLLSGRPPETSSEVVIPAHIAANGGVKISMGDTLALSVGNRMSGDQKLSQHDSYCAGEETLIPTAKKTYTVVGICQRPAIEEYIAPGYTLITTEDPAAADSLSVFITLKNPYQVHSYADSISDNYSWVLNDDVLRFMGLAGEKMFTVLLYSIGGILIALVMLGSELKPQFDAISATVRPTKLSMTFNSENPGQSTAAMQTMIDGASITADYNLYNVYEILEQSRNITFIVNMFSVVFITMISLIAVANVFNTISTNIKLRRREFAMLRSVGMADRDFKKMMSFECAFYGLRALLFGLPIAGILSWLIDKGLVVGGADIGFAFPWGSIGISVFSVFFVVFITMRYAISKIKRENIIDRLRDDII